MKTNTSKNLIETSTNIQQLGTAELKSIIQQFPYCHSEQVDTVASIPAKGQSRILRRQYELPHLHKHLLLFDNPRLI